MSDLDDAALVFKGAFDAYVATIDESSTDSRSVVRAMDELRAAVRLFSEVSVEATGWGNPFVSATDEVDEDRRVGAADIVQVEARYKLQVTNAHTFRDFVVDRVRQTGNAVHEEMDTPTAQVHELFAVDGWDPSRYRRPDLTVLQSRWSVSIADR